MLTYNKDIFKRILEPSGIKYFISGDREYYHIPSNRQMVWEFLFPKQIRDRLSLNKSSFSAINLGKSDKKNSTDAARDRFKQVLLYSNSEYYKCMYEHLHNIVESNAAVEMWLVDHKKTIKQVSLKLGSIDEYLESFPDKVNENKSAILWKLSQNFVFLKDEVISDVRFCNEFWEKVYDVVEIDPILLLEIVCLSSIFPSDDIDYDFFETIEKHYLNLIEEKNDKKVTIRPCTVETEKQDISDVFKFLENEKKRASSKFVDKRGREKEMTKAAEAIEKCEEYMSQLRCMVDQLEKNDNNTYKK